MASIRYPVYLMCVCHDGILADVKICTSQCIRNLVPIHYLLIKKNRVRLGVVLEIKLIQIKSVTNMNNFRGLQTFLKVKSSSESQDGQTRFGKENEITTM